MKRFRPLLLVVASALIWGAFLCWFGFIVTSAVSYRDRLFAQIRQINKPPIYRIGDRIDFRSTHNAMLVGWSSVEPAYRWSASQRAGFVFGLDPDAPVRNTHFFLQTACTLDQQRVTLRVNDAAVDSQVIAGPGSFVFPIRDGLLKPGTVNSVELVLPDARRPGNGDLRTLSVCLVDAGLNTGR